MSRQSGPAGRFSEHGARQGSEQHGQDHGPDASRHSHQSNDAAQRHHTAELGHRTWVFPAGRIPVASTGPEPEFTSREELCILNPGPQQVTAKIDVLLSDAEPLGPYTLDVGGRRVRHVRVNDLFDPVPIPLGVPYGLIVRTARPVVVQVVRTDTRRGSLTITTMDGYGTA